MKHSVPTPLQYKLAGNAYSPCIERTLLKATLIGYWVQQSLYCSALVDDIFYVGWGPSVWSKVSSGLMKAPARFILRSGDFRILCREGVDRSAIFSDSEQWFGETGRNLDRQSQTSDGKLFQRLGVAADKNSARHSLHALMDNMFHLRIIRRKRSMYTQVLEFSLSFTSCLRSLNCGVMDRSRPDSRVTIFPKLTMRRHLFNQSRNKLRTICSVAIARSSDERM
ncbi:hypothetical protein EVAR_84577_1 [Eumeta japonica]|uniref:Uncharacterized protein n=1 Tax=Eumeta variegata TaxID=151549 RepID=A0A4C1ZGU6_EUMVA|nr:hypothetical protein EVAR_84577_1 [Eumeta japonica]